MRNTFLYPAGICETAPSKSSRSTAAVNTLSGAPKNWCRLNTASFDSVISSSELVMSDFLRSLASTTLIAIRYNHVLNADFTPERIHFAKHVEKYLLCEVFCICLVSDHT